MRMLKQKGETVLGEKPFVAILNADYRFVRCDYCFALTDVRKCTSCKYVSYCDRNCQKMAWPLHRFECEKLSLMPAKTIPESALMIARILFKLKLNGNTERGYYDLSRYRTFDDLMSHSDIVRRDPRRLEHLRTLLVVLRSFLGEKEKINPYQILEIFGKMCINSFNILDNDMNSIGTGIYLSCSVLDHSCDPNAVAVFEGTTILIRTIKDIPMYTIDKVRISYVESLNLTETRRAELASLYYFTCSCSRCTDSWEEDELMKSMIPINKDVRTTDTSQVADEESSNNEELLRQYKDIMELSDQKLKTIKYTDINFMVEYRGLLAKQAPILTEFNINRVKTLDFAFEGCLSLQLWNEAMEYGLKLVPAFERYYKHDHPLVGMLYAKLFKLALLLNKECQVEELFNQAESIISITHGRDHSLYVELLNRMNGV